MQAIKKQPETQTRQQKYKSNTTLISNSSTIPSFLELRRRNVRPPKSADQL